MKKLIKISLTLKNNYLKLTDDDKKCPFLYETLQPYTNMFVFDETLTQIAKIFLISRANEKTEKEMISNEKSIKDIIKKNDSIIQECLIVLKRNDVKDELKKLFSPIIDLIII